FGSRAAEARQRPASRPNGSPRAGRAGRPPRKRADDTVVAEMSRDRRPLTERSDGKIGASRQARGGFAAIAEPARELTVGPAHPVVLSTACGKAGNRNSSLTERRNVGGARADGASGNGFESGRGEAAILDGPEGDGAIARRGHRAALEGSRGVHARQVSRDVR